MKNVFFILLLFCQINSAYAEQIHEWEQFLYQLSELEDIESSSWESSFNLLCDLEMNPININTATRDELEQLPFLTAKDIEAISEYLYRYGPMKTLGELVMIKDLSYFKRKLLFYFTYAGNEDKKHFPSLGNIMKYGKHEVVGTIKFPFYDRKGDIKGYQGYKYKHSLRYDFSYGDYVRLGFLGAQDAGEPFFAGRNSMGYDFYSFYFVLKKLGRIKTLVLGRYRLRFGMGLVLNNNFGFGKLSSLSSMGRGCSNIRAHSSSSDGNYFQGAAATFNLTKGLDVSLFVSSRKFDATLNKGDSTIATILYSGYHRTKTEMNKKNNSSHLLFGTNVDYRHNGFYLGATAVYTSLDKPLVPKTETVYRRHYAQGKTFYNLGVNYGYTGSHISFSGETATGECNAMATINCISYNVTDGLSLLALQRFYSYKYYSLFAESFSDGGAVQNESGIYVGLTWKPIQSLGIIAYTDYAYFAWPKYQASNSSHSSDNLLQVTYVMPNWTFLARYRFKIREKDNDDKTQLINKTEHSGRISAAFTSGVIKAKTQVDFAYTMYKDNSFGWMITQNFHYTFIKRLNIDSSLGYFDTDSYDSRVYSYEKGMLYSFSFPSFYGQGVRCSFMASYDFWKKITLTAKIGTTKYFDREQIGSGYQLIAHSSATDLELQLIMRL